MAKASLSYRQKVLLGNYLSGHFITNEAGEAVQTSALSMQEMLQELNIQGKGDECLFNDNHIHHARAELYGKLSKERMTDNNAILTRLMKLETRISVLEAALGVYKED
jgi:hypothetical protein